MCLCVHVREEPLDVGAEGPDTRTSQHTNVKETYCTPVPFFGLKLMLLNNHPVPLLSAAHSYQWPDRDGHHLTAVHYTSVNRAGHHTFGGRGLLLLWSLGSP